MHVACLNLLYRNNIFLCSWHTVVLRQNILKSFGQLFDDTLSEDANLAKKNLYVFCKRGLTSVKTLVLTLESVVQHQNNFGVTMLFSIRLFACRPETICPPL